MSYKPTSLSSLLNIKNRSLFLPHIQRPFVWEDDQVLRFLDSLLKNYPIQTFLFWKTKDEIKARKFMDNVVSDHDLSYYYDKSASEEGKEKIFVLDGQQRLQSLFSIFEGRFEGKDLYINLLDGDTEVIDGLSYRFEFQDSIMALPFYRIKTLTQERRNAEDIADEINQQLNSELSSESPQEKISRERRVRKNISQLISLVREDKHFWIEELDGIASEEYQYKSVLNIFIRVNNGGTKLDPADLMFAAMKEAWSDIEENIEDVVEILNSSGRIFFDKEFVLKCLMVAIGKGSTLKPELFTGVNADQNLKLLEEKWVDAERAFRQLRDFIYNDLKLFSEKVIRSYNSFVPIFDFFFITTSPTPQDIQDLKSYYYRSQLFNWYSSGTDQLINIVHGFISASPDLHFPLNGIKTYFQSQGKSINFTKYTLSETRLRFIILNLIYVEQFGNSPFNVAYKGNNPHIDHIYPKSKLSFKPTNEINNIGNYRFLGALDNLRKRAEDPASYFTRLKNDGLDISKHIIVEEYSLDPSQLTIENYDDFRTKRLEKIYEICDRIINR